MTDADVESMEFRPPSMVVCAGTVVLAGNKVLLVRQAEGHPLQGQWSIPWGIVDDSETPEDAAVRETREESGITAEIDGLLGIQNLPQQGWLGVIFLCHPIEGDPEPDGVETDRAAYFTLEDMESSEERFERWCEWLVRRVLTGNRRIIERADDDPYAPRHGYL
jgi:8-oxo-dGTP diphosphatase